MSISLTLNNYMPTGSTLVCLTPFTIPEKLEKYCDGLLSRINKFKSKSEKILN